MTTSRSVEIRVTPGQARMINAALALYEASEHDYYEGYREDLMERTRLRVWSAMEDAGVEP